MSNTYYNVLDVKLDVLDTLINIILLIVLLLYEWTSPFLQREIQVFLVCTGVEICCDKGVGKMRCRQTEVMPLGYIM